MDTQLFLQRLCELSLDEGKAYLQAHCAVSDDYTELGRLIKDESQQKEYHSPLLALKLAELLIFFGELVHHAPSRALGFIAKGNVMKMLGNHQEALKCSDAAGEEFQRLNDRVGWARSRISWIVSAAWSGHVDEALEQAEQAREIFLSHGEHYRAYAIDHNVAAVYEELGRYQDALKLYEKILTSYPALAEQGGISTEWAEQAVAMAELNRARILIWTGEFQAAYPLLEQAQARFEKLGQFYAAILTELNLADLDYEQGYYGSALRRYYQAYDQSILHHQDTSMRMAWFLLRMARCLVKLDRTYEACQLAARAVNTVRQFDALIDVGTMLREYAAVLTIAGQLDDALAQLDEAWSLCTQKQLATHAARIKLEQAELLLRRGYLMRAYEEARLAKQHFDARELISLSVRASLVMGEALIDEAEREGKHSGLYEALRICTSASEQARAYHLQAQIYHSQYLLGRIALLRHDQDHALLYYGDAVLQVERMLADLTHDLSTTFLGRAWMVYEEMILLNLQRGEVKQAFEYLERARSVALQKHFQRARAMQRDVYDLDSTAQAALQTRRAAILRTRHEFEQCQQDYRAYALRLSQSEGADAELLDRAFMQAELARYETRLSELSERLYLYEYEEEGQFSAERRWQSPERSQIEIGAFQRQLAPDQVVFAYCLCRGKLILFIMTRDQLVSRELVDGAQQLERLLPLLHARLQPESWPDVDRPPQQITCRLLKRLYDVLIAPVAAYLPASSGLLTIVPYGPLHTLPFHALYDGQQFMIEQFQISYLPACNVLTQLALATSDAALKAPEKAPLIFGYPGNGELQSALEEARTLTSMLNGRCYLEDEATIERLMTEAPGSSIIHIATHGKSRLDAPNFSSIVLADGPFTALDAFRLQLGGCELVTLSGCETGLALSGGGDEQLGLGRAFLAAGVPSLVMSLWPVEDTITSELMQCFYRRLLKGESKVQALRAAQCELLKRTDSPSIHPYFWASFRLVGNTD